MRRAPPSQGRPGRGWRPPAARGRTCGRPRPAIRPWLLVIGPERGHPGRELRDHLAVHRAVQQRRRQQRGGGCQRPHCRVHVRRRHPGSSVHRQPAAQHVVAVRRQPVAAPDQRGHVDRTRAARARQARDRHVDQATDHHGLPVEVQYAAPHRRLRDVRSRPAPSATRTAPRWRGCRRLPRSGRPRRRTPRPDLGAAPPTGPSGGPAGALATRGGALDGRSPPTLSPATPTPG